MLLREIPIVFTILILGLCICNGQTLSITMAGQRHDFRTVFVFPNTESWTDHTFGVQTYQLTYTQNFKNNINVGLSFGYELSKTPSGLHPNFSKINDFRFSIDRYRKYLFFMPLEYVKPLKSGFLVGLQILPSFGVHRSFKDERSLPYPPAELPTYHFRNVFFNDCEFMPFLEYKQNRISFRIGGRIFHLKRVDDAIFYKEYFDVVKTHIDTDVYTKKVDIYNPLKLFFSVGYTFRSNRQK